ncbi:MAG TPA: hypothetical protein VFJ58_28850 [Armatimonadota bacterium]|nr:hypothetical protein [Armatimonadota bacterium]
MPRRSKALERVLAAAAAGCDTLALSLLRLESLPRETVWLTGLRRLSLNGRRLESLPRGLTDLPDLADLNLSGNPGWGAGAATDPA